MESVVPPMASSPPNPGTKEGSSKSPPKKKPSSPPPFAKTEAAEDDESALQSLNAPIAGLGQPLLTSSEEMRKVYSHFAAYAADPASLKLPKPKHHLTLGAAEVEVPVPERKRDQAAELPDHRHGAQRLQARGGGVLVEENYNELDDQVKDIIIRNKSSAPTQTSWPCIPPRCSRRHRHGVAAAQGVRPRQSRPGRPRRRN